MSRVSVEELITTLAQPHRQLLPTCIAGIKPYIFASSPTITAFTFKLKQGATELFSKSLTMAEIKTMGSTAFNNFHGFVPFTNNQALFLSPGDYQIEMTATGYTYSSANFVGWCKDRVCYFGNIYGTIPANYTLNPYSYRLIEYQPREK